MADSTENTYWQKFINDNDENAFAHIYKVYVKNLYAYGVSLGFAPDVCKDAIQDVFFKIYNRKEELRHIDNFRFYIFRSTRNRLLDMAKQSNRKQSFDGEEADFSIEVTVLDEIVKEEENTRLKRKVEELLSLLTNRQREAVYLRYMQNLEYHEIAVMMNMNSESVRKLVYRALEAIRKTTKETSLPMFILLSQLFEHSL